MAKMKFNDKTRLDDNNKRDRDKGGKESKAETGAKPKVKVEKSWKGRR